LHGALLTGRLSFAIAAHSVSLPSEHETLRVWVPPPHLAEHSDQAPATQLGQACVEHAWDRVRRGQPKPPYCGCTVTEREANCEPPPHMTEQAPQSVHSVTWQFMGHW